MVDPVPTLGFRFVPFSIQYPSCKMDSWMRHEDSAQVWLEPVELRVWSFSECNLCGKYLKFSGFSAQIVEKKTNTIARGHGRNRLLESSRGNIACTDRPQKKTMELR